MHTFLYTYVAQSVARIENYHKQSYNHQLWAELQSPASSFPRKSSGQIVFNYFDHSFFLKKKTQHTTLQIAKVYPVLHKKEIGSEHLSMLDYTAELK